MKELSPRNYSTLNISEAKEHPSPYQPNMDGQRSLPGKPFAPLSLEREEREMRKGKGI